MARIVERIITLLGLAERTSGDSLVLSARTAGVLAMRIAWSVAAFGSTILVTRIYGSSVTGTFFLATAIMTVAATIALGGIELPLLSAISVAHRRFDTSAAYSNLRAATAIVVSAGALMTVGIVASSETATRLFGDPKLGEMLQIVGVAVVPFALVTINTRALNAIDRSVSADLSHRLGFQLLFGLAIALFGERTVILPLGVSFVATYFVLAIAGRLRWLMLVRPTRKRSFKIRPSALLRPGAPLLAAGGIQLVVDWSDTLMIGFFRSSSEVGIYGAATRLGGTLTLVLGAVIAVVGATFAALYSEGRLTELARLCGSIIRWSAAITTPVLVIIVLIPSQLMGLFGAGFSSGSHTLVLISIGQFFNTVAGPIGLLLAVAGLGRRVLTATSVAAFVNIALNAALIPNFGIPGAAMATLTALIASNALFHYFAYRDLGIIAVKGAVKRA